MANTEIREALRRLREVEKQVSEALDLDLTEVQRKKLFNLSEQLEEIDDFLVVMDLKHDVKVLEAKSKKLKKINEKVAADIESLKKIAKAVNDVAKVINALVEVAKILAKAGL